MTRTEFEISPEELSGKLRGDAPPVLVDVRRDDEVAICALAGAVHLPLNDLSVRLDELDPRAETVVYCHHGVRSLNATVMLRQAGFANVRSLAGGIDRWSREIDASVPRY